MRGSGGPALILAIVVAAGAAAEPTAARESPPNSPRTSTRGVVTRDLVSPIEQQAASAPSLAASSADPDLEAGFPAKGYLHGGTYLGGASVHTLVGNIDEEPTLEIFASALATGPLFAWNADGTPVPGWPTSDSGGVEYPGLGNLSRADPGLELFTIDWGRREADSRLQAYTGDATMLAGWPRTAVNYVGSVPVMADVDGDGLDEIFLNEQDWGYSGYRADGRNVPGWPITDSSGASQRRSAPAIADLDGNGDLELVGHDTATLFAYHHNGTRVEGFPKYLGVGGGTPSYPVVGDVDGDGAQEIVLAHGSAVTVFSRSGAVERTMTAAGGTPYGTPTALADLTGDGVPEIIVQTDGALDVFKGDGTALDGWPVMWGDHWLNSSSPVVGDVDGDQEPDIVITTHVAGSAWQSEIRAYRADGTLLPRFPKTPPIGSGAAAPAIADIDLDGRNEILVAGSSSAYVGYWDYLWAYDLGGGPHGPLEWGQFGGGAHHRSVYPVPAATGGDPAPSGVPSPGPARRVADIRSGPQGSGPSHLLEVDGIVYFTADDGVSGAELWRSDGTAAGTFLVKDIRAGPLGSDPRQLTRLGNEVLFVASDGTAGLELWKTDGTAEGTVLVKDVWHGATGSHPRELVASGGLVFFAAWDGIHGFELWRSDGTAGGTFMTKDILVGSGATPEGAGASSDPMFLTDVGGTLFFTALEIRVPFESDGISVFRSDGTSAGTQHLGELQYFSGGTETWNPGDFQGVGPTLFYSDGDQLGRSDGTFSGTVWFTEIYYGGDGLVDDLHPFRGSPYFPAREGGLGQELWKIEGGEAAMVINLAPTYESSTPRFLTTMDSRLYLSASNGSSGFELWRTDGTPGGTSIVKDIRPGASSSDPMYLMDAGGTLMFTARGEGTGYELWASDGTAAGTRLVHDIAPGQASSRILEPTRAGDLVFFSADDGASGHELWALPLAGLPQPEPIRTLTTGAVCFRGDCPRTRVRAGRDGYVFRGRTEPSQSGHEVVFSFKRPGADRWHRFGRPGSGAAFISETGPEDALNEEGRWRKEFLARRTPSRWNSGWWRLRARFVSQGGFAASQVVVSVYVTYAT